MKRTLFISLLVVILSTMFLFPVSAAEFDAMEAVAKAADPVIDGTIEDDAWGAPFVLGPDNSIKWDQFAKITETLTYRFAWSDKGLYVALSFKDAVAGNSSMLQLNCNPGGQVPDDQQGLFFSIFPNDKVMIHNQKTKLGDGTKSEDITAKVQIASKVEGDIKNIEVLLPIDAFRISDEDFAFAPGTMDASGFVMFHDGAAFTVGAAVSKTLNASEGCDWTLGKVGLGKITLQAKNATTGEAGNMALYCVIAACGICAASLAVYSKKRKLFE